MSTTRMRTAFTKRGGRWVTLALALAFSSGACSAPPSDAPVAPVAPQPDGGANDSGAATTPPIDAAPPQASELAYDQTIESHGLTRHYHVFRPDRHAGEPRPLVFILHGGTGSADEVLGRSGKPAPFKRWLDVAKRERLFVVAPDGSPMTGSPELGWNDCRADARSNPKTDDVAYILAILEKLSPDGVDRQRVYATGISNGGHMSLRLAIEAPTSFAAVAPVAAAMPAMSKCSSPSAPVSVLFVNGTGDPLCPYGGGTVGSPTAGRGAVLSTPESVSLWRTLNGVVEPETSESLPDVTTVDGCTVTRLRSRSEYPTVELLRVNGGGHTEPSVTEIYSEQARRVVGRQNQDVETADETYRFFRGHARP